MKCNQIPNLKCNNKDFHKCKTCKAPMLCGCLRPERLAETERLWNGKPHGGLRLIPPGDPKPAGYKLTPQQRRELFFDRLVSGQTPQQIADELRESCVINISERTVRNYRNNHYKEINAANADRKVE